ncbi:MAG: hypothetical protein IPP83_01270 [Flavobacteriales bacterium]|nr:hypothetical protein [Flavobacteriales bacterium]
MPHPKFLSLLSILFSSLNLFGQVADAGPDQWVCGDSAYMQGNFPGIGFTGTWSVYTGSGMFADAAYGSTQVTGLTYGDNELVWTVTDGFATTTDTVVVVAYDPSVTPVYTMGDTAITGPPFNIMLFASPFAYPQFCNWYIVSGSAYIFQPNAYTTYATDLGNGVNVFQWYCDNGPCGVSIQQLLISVNWITTSVVEIPAALPFRFDPTTGSLIIVSSERINDLHIRDLGGREVTGTTLPDGIYIASANVGGTFRTQRFVVSH